MSRRVLVTGASIAGNTAAWWLGRHGFDVCVVEKAPAFRDGGQNVDVRGAGREVLRRMGLERAALDNNTGERGTAWVDGKGREIARFDVSELGPEGPTAEMEILRGDLARLLHDAAREHAAYRFGDTIASLERDGAGAAVTFRSGRNGRFDAVIVAEGVGSPTREMLFPGENRPRWMDFTIGYFTIPRKSGDGQLWRWHNATRGRGVCLRPDAHGTTRAMLMLRKPPGGEQDWDTARQRAFLRDRFADVGWEAPRVLDGMAAAEDFYFEVLRQVRMPRWSEGCVALCGDAAWCATPLAGIGTTLAVVGAYVLAGELSRTADCTQAFAAYDRIMRPFVAKGQGVPKLAPRLANPDSRPGIALLHGVLRVMARPGIRGLVGKLMAGNAKEIELPRYGAAAAG